MLLLYPVFVLLAGFTPSHSQGKKNIGTRWPCASPRSDEQCCHSSNTSAPLVLWAHWAWKQGCPHPCQCWNGQGASSFSCHYLVSDYADAPLPPLRLTSTTSVRKEVFRFPTDEVPMLLLLVFFFQKEEGRRTGKRYPNSVGKKKKGQLVARRRNDSSVCSR